MEAYLSLVLAFLVGALLAAGAAARRSARVRRALVAWLREEGEGDPDLPRAWRGVGARIAERLREAHDEARAAGNLRRVLQVRAGSAERERDTLRRLLESLEDAVVLADAGGSVSFANRAAVRLLGPLKRKGASLVDAVERLSDEWAMRTREALAAGGRAAPLECAVGEGAERRILRVGFLPLEEEKGEPAGLALTVRDVTREVELHRMKSNFASSVSHELKTPLSSMKAFLEMLLDGDIEGEEERRATLQRLQDETDRLARLIQNLLHLSRLEAGVTKVERRRVDVGELLERLRDRMAPLALDKRQTLVFDVSDFLPAVTGDPQLLEQALTNLVSNAIKYTPEGGSIRVEAGLSGTDVLVEVTDTGVGIPEQALDLVFEKFTRIENQAGLEATGTGLGLPLVKFVAEIHGGSVSVRSEVGVGSTFTLRLPQRRSDASDGERLVGLEELSA